MGVHCQPPVQGQADHIGNYFGSGRQLPADIVHSQVSFALVIQFAFILSFVPLCWPAS